MEDEPSMEAKLSRQPPTYDDHHLKYIFCERYVKWKRIINFKDNIDVSSKLQRIPSLEQDIPNVPQKCGILKYCKSEVQKFKWKEIMQIFMENE